MFKPPIHHSSFLLAISRWFLCCSSSLCVVGVICGVCYVIIHCDCGISWVYSIIVLKISKSINETTSEAYSNNVLVHFFFSNCLTEL